MMRKIKPGKDYLIMDNDEPYIERLYEVFRKGQTAKCEPAEEAISFKAPKRQDDRDGWFTGNVGPCILLREY